MMQKCQTPVSEATLLDYWTRDLTDGDEIDRVEEHLFACGDCTARLYGLSALGTGLSALARQGRVSGIVSRSMLNRMQRDGVHVRMYSLAPGETVPCAVFAGDDLIVAAMKADLSKVDAVTLSVIGSGDSPLRQFDNVPLPGGDGEVFWATPAAVVREMPSMRLQLTLSSAGAMRQELGTYVLEHTAFPSGR